MNKKQAARVRRATKARKKIQELRVPRLTVHRTNTHIYAQVISDDGRQVVAAASTIDKEMRKDADKSENKRAKATLVGKKVAERALAKGIKKVAFDRSGFKYHGRIKALADGARESGLDF